MESYQRSNFIPTEASASKTDESRRFSVSTAVRTLVVLGVVASTAIFAYSSSGSTYHLSSLQRLQLAKSGRGHVRYSNLQTEEMKALFDEFKATYGKTYQTPEEESERFKAFVAFLSIADERNNIESSNGGTAVHGVTKFADRSDEEFKSLLGYKKDDKDAGKYAIRGELKTLTIDDYDNEKASSTSYVNWADTLTTAVKDQGYCGGCWAFSATSQIESDSIRAGYLTTEDELSPQQIISCDNIDAGCDGGWTEYAYYYVYEAGGLVSTDDYPYTSYYDQSGVCSTSSSENKLVTVDAYYTLDSEETMAAHVKTTGPLSICLDASTWSTYTSGIVKTCGTDVNHCVQVVGLNIDSTSDSSSYWIVRNSWGTSWGIDGYIYLEYGSDMCSITNDPTYVEVVQV